jgi:UDP:flavonoid glycosyltransferase YjiC (YdhE family)
MKTEGKSLPEGYDKNIFWWGTWLPQVEALAHPGVKAGVTHCGLGGSLEFIYSGVPALCFPHFGD